MTISVFTPNPLADVPARDVLEAKFLDWVNNYLTVEKFAEHNGLTTAQANDLIDLARRVYNSPHPES